jgi:hypothetical protein
VWVYLTPELSAPANKEIASIVSIVSVKEKAVIGAFPTGYPDELLYSICARYGERMQYPNKTLLNKDLFETDKPMASVGLSSSLDKLYNKLPPGRAYTVDDLIQRHTLFPLYAHFLPAEKARQLKVYMRGEKGAQVAMLAGIHISAAVPPHEWLRFCPQCVQGDRERFSECYWHRVHQVAGVEICPLHSVWLENSSVHSQGSMRSHEFVSAERACSQLQYTVRTVAAEDADGHMLFNIAKDVIYFLEQEQVAIEEGYRLHLYLARLMARKLALYGGLVRSLELTEAIEEYYGPELLAQLGCDFSKKQRRTWATEITRANGRTQHPLCHILMMRFLGYSAVELVGPQSAETSAETAFLLFGTGPWPCLNKAANHYLQPVVVKCHIASNSCRRRVIVGTFACSCGFVYSRTGPDRSPADRVKYTKVRSYGPVWDAALKQMWDDSLLSLRAIAKHLGVMPLTVRRYATDMGLPVPRPGGITTGRQLSHAETERGEVIKALRSRYRREWSAGKAKHPDWGPSVLQRNLITPYSWLFVHDRDWLRRNMPARVQKRKPTFAVPRINWSEIDERIAAEVAGAARIIKGKLGAPERVSVFAISKELQLSGVSHSRIAATKEFRDRLPLTLQAMDFVIESNEDFAVRRVWWAAQRYQQEGKKPTRTQLIRRTNAYKYGHVPHVMRAVDEAIESIL